MNMQEGETIIRTLYENIGASPDNYVDLKSDATRCPIHVKKKSIIDEY